MKVSRFFCFSLYAKRQQKREKRASQRPPSVNSILFKCFFKNESKKEKKKKDKGRKKLKPKCSFLVHLLRKRTQLAKPIGNKYDGNVEIN